MLKQNRKQRGEVHEGYGFPNRVTRSIGVGEGPMPLRILSK